MNYFFSNHELPKPASEEAAKIGIERLIGLGQNINNSILANEIQKLVQNRETRLLISTIFGNSRFLTESMITNISFFISILNNGPQECFDEIKRTLREAQNNFSEAEIMEFLRFYRKRASLLIAICDITGVWKDEKITQSLSEFGELCINSAINHLLKKLASSGDIELHNPKTPSENSGLLVLGMGKIGGLELNYSSDIDLILFYDGSKIKTNKPEKIQENYNKLAKGLVKIMSEVTSDGYVFRIDLRLRPDPSSTSPIVSVTTAGIYYENLGQNWERAALIKARPIAGDISTAKEFMIKLSPFIWRKYLDFATIHEIHSIKRQINSHYQNSNIMVMGHNIKLGRGGIREIEFFTQTQQLIWGGRIPELRLSPTCSALKILAKHGQISEQASSELIESYWFLRKVEHRLQMVNDQQTHTIPKTKIEVNEFAIFMGFKNYQEFEKTLSNYLYCVERHYDLLFEASPSLRDSESVEGNLIFTGVDEDPDTLLTIKNLGYLNPQGIDKTIRSWHRGHYRATQSTRARQILTELVPIIVQVFGQTPDPDKAFFKFNTFLSRLPSGIQLFSMFHAHPELIKLLSEIMGSAPKLAEHLNTNPSLIDNLLELNTIKRSTLTHLDNEIKTSLHQNLHFEDVLDTVRRTINSHKLQIGVQALKGMLSWKQIGRRYSDLAVITIQFLHTAVKKEFEKKHGKVIKGESVIISLGKVGGKEMTPTSDLDLIFVYRYKENSKLLDTDSSLNPSLYFTRLSQRFINAITTQTNEGELYSVDMRLRPSGNSGPIATHFLAFAKYHAQKSWTWEHMALSRARVISGSRQLKKDVKAIIQKTLVKARDHTVLRKDVLKMREKIQKANSTNVIWNVKYIRGGLLDIEFIVQYLQLKHASDYPFILSTNTEQVLKNLCKNNILSKDLAKQLIDALNLWQIIQGILRLTLQDNYKLENNLPTPIENLILNATNISNKKNLEHKIKTVSKIAFTIYRGIFVDETITNLRVRG